MEITPGSNIEAQKNKVGSQVRSTAQKAKQSRRKIEEPKEERPNCQNE